MMLRTSDCSIDLNGNRRGTVKEKFVKLDNLRPVDGFKRWGKAMETRNRSL